MILLWLALTIVAVAIIVWGAETFAEHLGRAAVRLRISLFALSLLLAGAEPEELVTAVAASLKNAPGIAFGDVIGANVAICLVALGVGSLIAPIPFGRRVKRYALLGIPLGIIATALIWNGQVDRLEGFILVLLYILYVAGIWIWERQPPTLGETEELEEARSAIATADHPTTTGLIGRELLLVLTGVAAMAGGATLLVEAVTQIAPTEVMQTNLGLTLVGFATAFELVVLAWSTARRGISEAVVAGVIGSFAYNVTMTLGVAAVVRPLQILDARRLHFPAIAMLAALLLVILLAAPRGCLNRTAGIFMLVAYPLFTIAVFSGT